MIYFMPEKEDIRKALRRQPGGNKGTFGKLAVIAGSEKTPGAALLCTKAAFATGCGYIRLMTAEENKKLVLSVPEVVFQPRQKRDRANAAVCLLSGNRTGHWYIGGNKVIFTGCITGTGEKWKTASGCA